jgi:hypothetical protein
VFTATRSLTSASCFMISRNAPARFPAVNTTVEQQVQQYNYYIFELQINQFPEICILYVIFCNSNKHLCTTILTCTILFLKFKHQICLYLSCNGQNLFNKTSRTAQNHKGKELKGDKMADKISHGTPPRWSHATM